MAISIPSIHQSYVHFILQTNSISSCQVKQQHPQTTLWHQCWTPSMTLQSFNNPISIPLSTIQWRVRHESNPTHAANNNEIKCGIHEEDGYYIVDCTKEQQFDDQWEQQSIIRGWRTRNEEQWYATSESLNDAHCTPSLGSSKDRWGYCYAYFSPLTFLVYSLHAPASCLLFIVYILISFYRLYCAALLFICSLMHSTLTHAQSCTVCLLMHSLLRCSLVTQYIRTG